MTDHPRMTIDDVIRDLGGTKKRLPRVAMQWSLDNWSVAGPRFLALLSQYADGADRSESAESALFVILHLLAEKAETAAFGDLCRILREPAAAEHLLGDAITTTLRQMLFSTFDGNVATLRSVIEAAEADEFARDAALLAMAYLTRIGRIPTDDMHAYLRHLVSAMQPQGECYIWVSWIGCVALLGMADFATDAKQIFERGFIEDTIMSFAHFEEDLQATLDDPESMRGFDQHGLEPFTSAIDELSGWYGFSEEYLRDEARRAAREAAAVRHEWPSGGGYRNPWRDVGRNDACPCGSGRKYKKCCLGKPESEQLIASAVGGV